MGKSKSKRNATELTGLGAIDHLVKQGRIHSSSNFVMSLTLKKDSSETIHILGNVTHAIVIFAHQDIEFALRLLSKVNDWKQPKSRRTSPMNARGGSLWTRFPWSVVFTNRDVFSNGYNIPALEL